MASTSLRAGLVRSLPPFAHLRCILHWDLRSTTLAPKASGSHADTLWRRKQMQIHSKGTGALTPETHAANRTDNADKASVTAPVPGPASIDRADKVEISDAGRALAARETDRSVAAG